MRTATAMGALAAVGVLALAGPAAARLAVIEGEALAPRARASAGPVEVQPMQGFGGQWSGGAQLFWRAPPPVDKPIRNWPNLRLPFDVATAGTYELTLVHTLAPDYGKFRLFLDGKVVADVDGWAPRVDVRQRALGEHTLAAGSHELVLTVFARNPASTGWYVGIDALRLTAAGQAAPEAREPRLRLQKPGASVKPGPSVRGAVTPSERSLELVARIAAPATLPDSLTDEDRATLSRIAGDLKRGDRDRATRTWEGLLSTISSRGGTAVDVDALVQSVLRESYLDELGDLASYADKVRFFNEQKKAIREQLQEARERRAALPHGQRARLQTIVVAPRYEKGESPVRAGAVQAMGERELAAYIEGLEERLQTAGEDGQLANTDLQSVLQKQRQTLQTLANISKLLHETAMGIIRKID